MGTEINSGGNENEKINEDDIIENDCYEEIDMRKINQIIEKEKNWNNNTIIYSNNNLINISNEMENENENEKNPEPELNKENDNKENVEKEKKEESEKKEKIETNKKHYKKLLHIMPKIRPKNTCDEALNQNKDKKNNKTKEKANKQNHNIDNNNSKNVNNKKKDKSKEKNIHNIINKNKLNNLKEDEVMYSGVLEKILNEQQANKLVYAKRFCVLTKKYFSYYKSKESYISLNRPMLIIEKDDIIRIENTFLDGEGYFGIVCEVNDRTKNLINKVNSFVTNDENSSQLLLGFRSNKYEEMTNWILMLNYFVSHRDSL